VQKNPYERKTCLVYDLRAFPLVGHAAGQYAWLKNLTKQAVFVALCSSRWVGQPLGGYGADKNMVITPGRDKLASGGLAISN
jgi:hypothetical protein